MWSSCSSLLSNEYFQKFNQKPCKFRHPPRRKIPGMWSCCRPPSIRWWASLPSTLTAPHSTRPSPSSTWKRRSWCHVQPQCWHHLRRRVHPWRASPVISERHLFGPVDEAPRAFQGDTRWCFQGDSQPLKLSQLGINFIILLINKQKDI